MFFFFSTPISVRWELGQLPPRNHLEMSCLLNAGESLERFTLETVVSSIAALLTTAAFIPQAYKIIHTRETKGVSLWMHITFAVGVAFWFTLGVMLWNWPMMLANAVTFMLTVVIVIMKLKYR